MDSRSCVFFSVELPVIKELVILIIAVTLIVIAIQEGHYHFYLSFCPTNPFPFLGFPLTVTLALAFMIERMAYKLA